MGARDIRLIIVIASLRAGGMRIRWRQLPAARRALAAAGDSPGAAYRALETVFNPRPHEREVFDAVAFGGFPSAGRVLPPPASPRRRVHA